MNQPLSPASGTKPANSERRQPIEPSQAFSVKVPLRGWPWVVLALLPLVLPHTLTDLMVFAGLYYIAGLGVGLALSQCGIVNLGQALFYGIGAYASAALATRGVPMPLGMLAGVLVTAALSVGLGWPILRLSGFFLGLATLALGIIGSALFLEWDLLTGGSLGIGGIPRPMLFGVALDTPERYYALVWTSALAITWVITNLVNGRTGLLLRSARDSAEAALSLGLPLRAMRTFVFVVCAMLASIAGSLFAHYATFVSVDSFSLWKSLTFLLIPVIGGRSPGGMLSGALFVTLVPHYLGRVGDIHAMLFGAALTLLVVLLPNGIGSLRALTRRSDAARKSTNHG